MHNVQLGSPADQIQLAVYRPLRLYRLLPSPRRVRCGNSVIPTLSRRDLNHCVLHRQKLIL